ncbi:MAG: PAS domain S-box protein [Acidobacteriota bacterium]|nr:PAS domain S-box protein [Acidobacteriota bacterium]
MENEQAGKNKNGRSSVEFRLRERERFLRTLIGNLPGVVFRCRNDAHFTKEFVSDGCFDLTGYLSEEIVGENAAVKWSDIVHPEEREAVFGELRRLIAEEQTGGAEQFQISYRLVARDCSIKHIRDRFRFVRDSIGEIIALEGFATDVTEQRKAEEALRESEERFRALFDSIDEGYCIIEMIYDDAGKPVDYRFLQVSPSWEKQTGLPDALGKTIRALVPQMEDFWFETFGKVAATGEAVRFENRAEFMNRWFDVYAFRLGAAEKRQVAVLLNDITTRRLAEEKLRVSENRYKLLAENMRDLVCLHELDAKYVYVSPSSSAMLGYAPGELVGASPFDLIHPEDVERVRDEAHAPLLEGASGIVSEYRMRDKRGDHYWFETMWQTVAASDGEILQLQTVSRDISKRKEEELGRERAQNDLAQMFVSEQAAHHEADAARVEAEHANRAKDEFLQMVSHEFRTPLTTIKTLVRVLQHGKKSEAVRQKHLETIAAECDRQVDMILNLLDVSRLEEGDVDLKREPVDVSRVLASCDKIERPAAEARKQTLTVERGESLPKIAGDEKAMRRALCTIIENAIKYTPEGGMITVAARHIGHRVTADNNAAKDKKIAAELFGDLPQQMNFPIPLENSEEIAVIVCDTGRGILPADIAKVFLKFYRGAKPHQDSSTDGTPDDAAGKAETPGVGLGLYLAKRLITALGGRITVNSEVGRGSCFTIYLPVWNEAIDSPDAVDEYDFDEGGAAQ